MPEMATSAPPNPEADAVDSCRAIAGPAGGAFCPAQGTEEPGRTGGTDRLAGQPAGLSYVLDSDGQTTRLMTL